MRIRLLGDLEVVSPEGRPVRFATRKSSLLFAALVLAGHRGHRREQLSEAFWPGRSDAQSRNNLRQALVDIRRLFPAGNEAAISIEGDQDTVSLIAGLDEADIWIFDRELEGGVTADLALAADLYRGDLLAGEAIPDGLEEWFAPYQEQISTEGLAVGGAAEHGDACGRGSRRGGLRRARGEAARVRPHRRGRPSGADPDSRSSRPRKRGASPVRASVGLP